MLAYFLCSIFKCLLVVCHIHDVKLPYSIAYLQVQHHIELSP